jgi:hypothetical protein
MRRKILGGLSVITTMFVATASLLAENKVIHVGGMCSTEYYDKKYSRYTLQGQNEDSPGIVNGWRNIDARLDNRGTIYQSVNQLRDVMNNHCNRVAGPTRTYKVKHRDCVMENEHGACKKWDEWYETITERNDPDQCYVIVFSGGDAIMRQLLATEPEIDQAVNLGNLAVHQKLRPWNIISIFAGGGAGGGSELAELADEGTIYGSTPGGTAFPAGFLPWPVKSLMRFVTDQKETSCTLTNYLDPSSVRNAWGAGRHAFDDTMGTSFYHIGGHSSRMGGEPDGFCNKDFKWYDILLMGTRQTACAAVETTFGFIGLGKDDAAVGYHSSLGRAEWKAFNSLSDYGKLGNYQGHYTGLGRGNEISVNKWHLWSKNQWLIQNGWFKK